METHVFLVKKLKEMKSSFWITITEYQLQYVTWVGFALSFARVYCKNNK